MELEIKKWRQKSLDAYTAEITCATRLRNEIIHLRALVSPDTLSLYYSCTKLNSRLIPGNRRFLSAVSENADQIQVSPPGTCAGFPARGAVSSGCATYNSKVQKYVIFYSAPRGSPIKIQKGVIQGGHHQNPGGLTPCNHTRHSIGSRRGSRRGSRGPTPFCAFIFKMLEKRTK